MYWQREVYRAAAAWPNGGTYTLELPNNGLLGSIMIHAYRAGVTDSMLTTQKWRLIDWISKIEVVADGSTIIKSVTGQVQHFLQWMDGGGAAPDQHFNYGSSTKRCRLMLNFGRQLFDPEYGLDLGAFKSVELKLTNDGSSTYFGGDWGVDIVLYYLREPAISTFKGFMRTEEWRKWTTVQGEIKYLDLPVAEKVRRAVMQVVPGLDAYNMPTTTPYNVAYNIELLLKTGLLKVWEGNLRHLWYDNYFDHGRDVIQPIQPYHTAAYGIWTGVGQTLSMGGVRIPHDGIQDTATPSFSPGEDSSAQKRFTQTDADQEALLLMGLALENCAYFRFDHNRDPETYLDPRVQGTVQLNITTRDASSAAGGTIRVVLDRLAVP